jgi:predicted transport protein
LFRLTDGKASQLAGSSMALEKSLQHIIEHNMETLFGVRFLDTEYSTGTKHRGRIDSLGIDENGSPVIFEYKRAVNENVITQGLFYLDWLLDHRAEFKLLVMEKLGADTAAELDWGNPRLICVASGFTRYDEHAVQQMNRSIELYRYQDYEGDLLALDLVSPAAAATPVGEAGPGVSVGGAKKPAAATSKTVSDYLDQSPASLKDLMHELDAFAVALGDDVTKRVLKSYFAYRRIKNFLCVEVHPQNHELLIFVKVNPDTVTLEPGFSRDVRAIGHFGTGDLELRIGDGDGLRRATPLIQQSCESN